MSLIFIIPGLISVFLVWKGWIETALLSVYLPCLLCLPEDYQLRVPHLPPTSVSQFALIPLAVVAISKLIQSSSIAPMDVLVFFYSASIGLSEILHASVLTDGIFTAINAFITIFLAYVTGRMLVEPDLRLAVVKRFVILVLLNVLPGLYEWRMQQSLYGKLADSFLGYSDVSVHVQPRNGHGRMSGSFLDAELAGIAFAMTFCLNAWLVYLRRVRATVDLSHTLATLEKYHVPELVLLLSLLLTQSRGPLIGLAAGFLILQIPRFKRTRTMTIVVAVVLVTGYFVAQAHFASFENIDPSVMTEQQSSTIYRIRMNKIYGLVAEQGGWTGYGLAGIPFVGIMKSIDNHYLLVHLAWGRLGYIFFVLVVLENIRVLLVRSWQFEALADRAFVFSMMGTMVVLWATLLTVYMGSQLPQISFLLVGWIQSIAPGNAPISSAEHIAEDGNQKFSFRQVLT
jgi:hypothetical protein